VASVYEDMTDSEKKVADCLQELGLWWWYRFPVFIYDETEKRVWTPEFYIPELGMYIEVCSKKREDYEHRETLFNKNGYQIVFLHLYKEQKKWKKYLVTRLKEIEDLRHSEIEKMIESLHE
jgi:hypothetical protein